MAPSVGWQYPSVTAGIPRGGGLLARQQRDHDDGRQV